MNKRILKLKICEFKNDKYTLKTLYVIHHIISGFVFTPCGRLLIIAWKSFEMKDQVILITRAVDPEYSIANLKL